MSSSSQRRISGYGVGAPSIRLNPPPIISNRAPTTTDTRYPLGQEWVYQISATNASIYFLGSVSGGVATWVVTGGGSSDVNTINGLSPTAGNINIVGTAAQIGVANAGSTVTLSLIGPYTPATYTAHGVLIGEGAGSIAATAAGTDGQVLTGNTGADPAFAAIGTKSGLTAHGVVLAQGTSAFSASAVGTDGQVFTGNSAADPTFSAIGTKSGLTGIVTANGAGAFTANAVTEHGVLIGGASNAASSLAVAATGTLLAGATGADPAFTASPSVSGNMTAATGFIATTAGSGVTLPVTTASGAGSGTVNCDGRTGSVTFTGLTINAAADQTLVIGNTSIAGASTRVLLTMSGATTGSALSIKSITPSANTLTIVVTNGTGATASTADITFDFLVLN